MASNFRLILMITASIIMLSAVSGQLISRNSSVGSDGGSNQRIGVASQDSNEQGQLEQLVAAVNDIRQRQRLNEQERQVGKLLELQQLQMLLRQQQSKYNQLVSIQGGIVEELRQVHQMTRQIQGSFDALRSASLQNQTIAAFGERVQALERQLSDRLDRLQHNMSLDSAHSQRQHDNLLENMQNYLRRLPEHSRVLVQQHYGGTSFFNRTWDEFKVGFGDVTGNYWIGNDRLHDLTKYGQYRLRVDLQLRSNRQWYWAEYNTFRVENELAGYRLNLGGHSGTAGDSLAHSNGMQFSTRDRDNDIWPFNCATHFDTGNGGGFWYRDCAHQYINAPIEGTHGFVWHHMGAAGNSWSNKLLISRLKLLPIT